MRMKTLMKAVSQYCYAYWLQCIINYNDYQIADNVSVTTGSKGSPEGMESEIVNSRSVSSTNSSSSTDRITSGSSELSVASGNKVSGLVMNTKSKPDT